MIKEICIQPGCPSEGRYCRVPWHPKRKTGSDGSETKQEKKETPAKEKAPAKKKKPIPKVSAQRKEDNKKYNKEKRKLKKKQPTCQIKVAGVCINTPVHPHHVEGRTGSNFHNPDKMINACDPCNDYLEANPKFAEAHGFKKTRLKHSEKRQHLYEKSTQIQD
jgi:hypothetical protein